MRLIRLFIVAFAPSVWFNDIFVVLLEYFLEGERPIEACEAPVAMPEERTAWEFASMPTSDSMARN